MEFSNRMDGLTSAIFAQLHAKKYELLSNNREVIDFSIGTPDLPPAQFVIDTLAKEASNPENYKYAISDLPELVEAAVRWYDRRYNVSLEKDEVSSLLGSQDGLSHIALTLANPGDIVMVPDPCYPIFSVGPQLACASLYKTPLLRENDFLIDFDSIDATVAHAAKLMVVSYPNNPVTAVAPPEFYEKLIWFAKKYDIVVLHDNAYSELVFDGAKGMSFLSFKGAKDVGVEFNSLSKSHNLTGCRISFALGNRKVIEQLKTLKSHLDYGIFLPVQKAAIAALDGPQDCVEQTKLTYQNRRNVLFDCWNSIGWKIEKTPATMFSWLPLPTGYTSSVQFAFELIEKTGIIVVPGSSFGERGEGFVRLALVQSEDKIREAAQKIKVSGMIR
jgi:LL-diaminopimelate aminotransferase